MNLGLPAPASLSTQGLPEWWDTNHAKAQERATGHPDTGADTHISKKPCEPTATTQYTCTTQHAHMQHRHNHK